MLAHTIQYVHNYYGVKLCGIHFAIRPTGDASRGAKFLRGRWASLKELAELVRSVVRVVVAAREGLANCLCISVVQYQYNINMKTKLV